jgi:hypothetical protein
MTKLKKAISREAMNTAEQGRPLMVTLEPGDTISFRQKGLRKVYRTTLAACFWLAVKTEAAEERRIKALARAERRNGRKL